MIMALLLFLGCGIDNHKDEYIIMNTVCIDGYLCFSVTNGIECDYIPVIHNNKKVECGNE